MAQISGADRLRSPRGPRVALAALACWTVGELVFAASSEDSVWRAVAANAVYFMAMAFALVLLARAAPGTRGRERLFWGLLLAGSLAGLVGDLGWRELQESAFAAQNVSYQHVAYLISYLLLICALLLLIGRTMKQITLITFLDSLSIMLSVGIMI